MGETQRLLFVDDDPRVRSSFARALRRTDYELTLAAGGDEAISLALSQEYPVVVTDLRMPGVDGLTLMVRLRSLHPDTVFVVITGAPDLDLKADERIDDAIASVIAKPWEERELFASLTLAFELHKKRLQDSSSALAKFDLLIIEDEADKVAKLRRILSSVARITVCPRLEVALSTLHEQRFEVVLTKLSLPDARGLDAVTRSQRAQPQAAVIVTSEIEDEALAIHALRFGAQDYLQLSSLSEENLLRSIQFARERKQVECRLVELAHYDSLTGLANRTTLRDRLSVCLAKARRNQEECALLYIDLDFFKPVNDKYGHEVGDQVLQQVSARMRAVVREYDTVSRIGGDEFAVLLEDLAKDNPEEIALRILDRIRLPIRLGDVSVQIGASGGLAIFPGAADNIDSLVRCADRAMYKAKEKGRNCLQVDRGDKG